MIILKPEHERDLEEALLKDFTPETLASLVMDRIGFQWQERSAGREHRVHVQEFIEWCRRENRVGDLLRIALAANPTSAELQRLNKLMGVLRSTTDMEGVARKVIGEENIAKWRDELNRIQNQVGVVRAAGGSQQAVGTGFLVGPDQIMTSVSVLDYREAAAASHRLEFVLDVATGAERTYGVVPDSIVRLECGVALLRLTEDAGREASGRRSRGWMFLRNRTPASRFLAIVQYVRGTELMVSVEGDAIGNQTKDRIIYSTSTSIGSSGSPCFDEHWNIIAVHGGSYPPHGNWGVRIAAIEDELNRLGILWGSAGIIELTMPIVSEGLALDELLSNVSVAVPEESADNVWDEGTRDASDPEDWKAAEAAAVVAYFDPAKLITMDGTRPSESAIAAIKRESRTIRRKPEGGRYLLNERLRVRALQRLGSEENLQTLRALNPDHSGELVDDILGKLIRGDYDAKSQYQDAAVVRALIQATTWLKETELARRLPDPGELHRILERATLIAPFRHLTRGFFAGRNAELAKLAAFVSDPGDGTMLLIHGPGGMGKSALISHFMLLHATPDTRDEKGWRPFLYLDFDRPELDARDLPGVLLAMLRQLAPQVPEVREEIEATLSEWNELRRDRRSKGRYGHDLNRQSKLVNDLGDRGDLFEVFSSAVKFFNRAYSTRRAPIVVVLDTLEEVQYATPTAVGPLVDVMDALARQVVALRPILAGRVAAELPSTRKTIELAPLAPEFAAALLENELPEALAQKKELIAKMVDIVGGNPLSLRLAAQVLGHYTDRMDELGEEDVWERVGDAIVQGHLYERIAGHIHDESVRKLAIPGLILRFVTPDLIRRVLAGPCKVRVDSDVAARDLFDKLGAEIALVRQAEGPDKLSLRPELRRTVLHNLRQDRSSDEQRKRIHEAAVAYYAGRKGKENRAEEIYHRLWLNQSPREIDARWMDGIERSLREASEELEGPARLYLMSRLGGDDEEALRASASLFEWEGYVERRVTDLLRLGAVSDALALLHERSERLPGSRLHLLESIAWRSLPTPDYGEAEQAAKRAVEAARLDGNQSEVQGALQELLQVQRVQEDIAGAMKTLAHLGELGEQLGDDLLVLQSEVEELESVYRNFDPAVTLTEPAIQVFHRLPDDVIVRAPELSRRVAAQVGASSPEILQRVSRLVGFGPVPRDAADDLREILEAWRDRVPSIAAYVPAEGASSSDIMSATRYLLSMQSPDPEAAQRLSTWMSKLVAADTAGTDALEAALDTSRRSHADSDFTLFR